MTTTNDLFNLAVTNARDEFDTPPWRSAAADADYIIAETARLRAPACTNCGGPLGMSALYCESCIRRDDEQWFAWRDRLAQVRP